MKQMTLIEMDGFLKGKCIPSDLKVNETNAEYLVRKFAEAEAKCAALAAENAALKQSEKEFNNFCRQEYYGWEDNFTETPSTDAFLAEVRASSIPEGYVLVPQQIFLEPSDIESICSQCGDGHESGYGDFTNGLLWVGNIQCDDGSIVHGLHISSADYSEDGGVTVCEFAAQLRKGGNQ
ncbi:hypothetical protein E7V43_15910 [Escherichia coli]|nr:hypothetical protein [Escherichia coli]